MPAPREQGKYDTAVQSRTEQLKEIINNSQKLAGVTAVGVALASGLGISASFSIPVAAIAGLGVIRLLQSDQRPKTDDNDQKYE